MSNLLTDLMNSVPDETLDRIGQKVNVPTNQKALLKERVFTSLLTGMSKNISQKENEAQKITKTLDKHHHNDVDLDQILSSENPEGEKILGHIFGNDREKILETFSKREMLSPNQTNKLFKYLAPVFMNSLAGSKNKINADSDILGEMIGISGELLMGKKTQGSLSNMLDFNKNGTPLDDIFKFASKFFKKKK